MMRPSPSRVRPETDQDNREPGRRPASRPVVERVAGWSVRHRKTAVSVGAAYGLITLIFQDGRLQSLLGYTSFGGIIAWEPLFMFVFLFGISMDYHVFLLSRIRELRSQGYPARDAIVEGIASSAGVVTSAAFIMVTVFSVFATLSLIDLKILGVGMAAAVLIDATVVRGVLLPAALALLGERT
jgi:RND superfamily putative drug exporter